LDELQLAETAELVDRGVIIARAMVKSKMNLGARAMART
jgi:hypothetical protein